MQKQDLYTVTAKTLRILFTWLFLHFLFENTLLLYLLTFLYIFIYIFRHCGVKLYRHPLKNQKFLYCTSISCSEGNLGLSTTL